MRLHERFAKAGNLIARLFINEELPWVGAPCMAYCDCFASPDQLSAASAEVSPSAESQFRRFSICSAIPPFHRVYRKAVPDLESITTNGICQRRLGPADKFKVAGNRGLDPL
jgi:hypothetical protein